LTPTPAVAGAAIFFLILIWGSTWAAIRIGLQGVPPFTSLFLRFALASVTLLVLAPRLGAKLSGGKREWKLWIASGLLTFGISYGVVYWSEQWVPSALASILFATFPLFVAGLARFFLPGETLRGSAVAGIVLGFVGVGIIFSEDLGQLGGPNVALYSVVMLLSPISSALGNVLVKAYGKNIHPLTVTVIPMMIGCGIMGALAVIFERDLPRRFDALSVGSIVYLALFGTALTFTLYFWLLSHLPATKLSLITYGTPIVAVILGDLLLGEKITPRVLAGAGTVIAGVFLAGRK
jgi:drug/metabolite transporter (DMT)-like permease